MIYIYIHTHTRTFPITKGYEPSLVGITKSEVQERKDIDKRFENIKEIVVQPQREK